MPDLADFRLHKLIYDVDFDGVAVPGLCGAFYRCTDGARTLSIGIYLLGTAELFRAWGYVDEEHCTFHSVTCVDGDVDGPYTGCPDVRVHTEPGRVTGLLIRTPQREYHVDVPPPGGHALPADGGRPLPWPDR